MDTVRCAAWSRTMLLILLILQLVSALEKQIFDFFGDLWMPIIGNFLHLLIVVVGVVGVCSCNRWLVVTYGVWCFLWMAWNAFIMCLYLEVGTLNLNHERHILTLGASGRSQQWLRYTMYCEVANSSSDDSIFTNHTNTIASQTPMVKCSLQYFYVELIHTTLQCFLSLVGLVSSFMWNCCIKNDCNHLLAPLGSSQHPNLSNAFPRTSLTNRAFHCIIWHKPGSGKCPSCTGNLDFQLPSLPQVAFPHSPDYPISPKYPPSSRTKDPMLGRHLRTPVLLATPAGRHDLNPLQNKAFENSLSDVFVTNHYMCATFFSYPATKRTRLGALSFCFDQDDAPEKDDTVAIDACRSDIHTGNPTVCHRHAADASDDTEMDDDIWILQTEL